MRATVVARVALVAVAVVAGAWLAFGLRAVDLQSDGQEEGRAAGRPPQGARLEQALDLLRRAGERNPDPRPQLDEASLLLASGDSRGAAALLEDVVERNPGSIRGWGLLAAATAAFDERRSLQANGALLELYGRVPGELGSGVIRSSSGRRYRVFPGHARGFYTVRRRGALVVFEGWAGIPSARRPAQEVLVVSHGRVVAARRPDVRRRDIAPASGGSGTGFRFTVPGLSLLDKEGEIDAHVLGAGLGAASLLTLDCRTPQLVGC